MTAAALLVYDITDNDTFLRVTKWVKELKQMANKDIVMAIAANKSDLVRSKHIDTNEAARYSSLLSVTNTTQPKYVILPWYLS
jgi:GTPase SAR1 family protein